MEEYKKVNLDKEVLECSNCRTNIKPGDEYYEPEEGTVFCPGCYNFAFPKCEFCGERVSEDEIKYWGDCYCCPDCYEDFNPSFDPDENEEETTEAYEAMLKRYIGRKSKSIRDDTVELEAEYPYQRLPIVSDRSKDLCCGSD